MPNMTAIAASELASIQSDMAALTCDLTATIQQAVRTPEAEGGASVTWTTVTQPSGATTPVGMAQPTGGLLQNFDYLVGSKAAWMLKFPVAAVVAEQNRAIIKGQTLEIVKDLTPRSYPFLLTCLAVEVL